MNSCHNESVAATPQGTESAVDHIVLRTQIIEILEERRSIDRMSKSGDMRFTCHSEVDIKRVASLCWSRSALSTGFLVGD